MAAAVRDPELERPWALYPGDRAYRMDDRIEAVPVNALPELAVG
jgi:hypothetical protein